MSKRVLSWSVAIVLGRAAPGVGLSAPAPAGGSAAACDAALAVIKEHLPGKGRWAVLGSSGSRDDNLTPADLRKDLKKDRPSPALSAQFIGQWEQTLLPSAPMCAAYLDQGGIAHDQAAIDRAQPKPTIFGLSLPVVSADGREALADIGADTGFMARSVGLAHLRKDAGGPVENYPTRW